MRVISWRRSAVGLLAMGVAGALVLTVSDAREPSKQAGQQKHFAQTGEVEIALGPLSIGNPTAVPGPRTHRLTPKANSAEPVAVEPSTFDKVLTVGSGDTLSGVLTGAGIPRTEAAKAISALKGHYNPRDLRPGQRITVTFKPGTELKQADDFVGLRITPDLEKHLQVARLDDGDFETREVQRDLKTQATHAAGTIELSLYMAAKQAHLPGPVLADLIRLYSWDVDFQRDIRKGDHFEVVYEEIIDERGQRIATGEVLYSTLTLSGDERRLYRFESDQGMIEYFDETGQSAKKALMRTPIDGARLSSGYGKRRHPVLGYTKMHRGVDFAAPTGTPIYAAGDGIVEKAGWNGGYGKYIRIRHNADYDTAYAHMSRFAKGMHAGKRVKQGQIIGYVGTTGRSTGPHLHYEILKGSRQTNPLRVKMPSGRKLAGSELKRFQTVLSDLTERIDDARERAGQLAQATPATR